MLLFQDESGDQKNNWTPAIKTSSNIKDVMKGNSTFHFELRWGCRATWYGKIAQEPRFIATAYEKACPNFKTKEAKDSSDVTRKIAIPLVYDMDLAKKKVGDSLDAAVEMMRVRQ